MSKRRRSRFRGRTYASRTLGTGVYPGLDEISEQFLGTRGRVAAFAGLPAPCDEIVAGGVIVQARKVAPAVALRILQLSTNLANRLALPRHLDRRQAPARV